MKKEIITTKDGSPTILLPDWKVTYHSTFGAIQESKHIYLCSGLDYTAETKPSIVRIFEMGLGTGLNALLTAIWAEEKRIPIQYTAIDLYPLTIPETEAINYHTLLKVKQTYFQKIHATKWETIAEISPWFQLKKQKISLLDFKAFEDYNLIYFDAFDPTVQPELWTTEVFIKLYNMLSNQGILVTYSCKSEVRRNMQAAGFTIKKLKGPPGKREILRAVKML